MLDNEKAIFFIWVISAADTLDYGTVSDPSSGWKSWLDELLKSVGNKVLCYFCLKEEQMLRSLDFLCLGRSRSCNICACGCVSQSIYLFLVHQINYPSAVAALVCNVMSVCSTVCVFICLADWKQLCSGEQRCCWPCSCRAAYWTRQVLSARRLSVPGGDRQIFYCFYHFLLSVHISCGVAKCAEAFSEVHWTTFTLQRSGFMKHRTSLAANSQ